MILYNKTLFTAPLQFCRMAACVLALFAVGLAGCSDAPHDRVEAPAPAKLTTLPTPAKPAGDNPEAKPAKPAPAAPTEAELGMPIYPNAKPYTGLGGNTIKPDMSSGMALLETPDSLDKVVDFYKTRIKATDARGNATPIAPRETKDAEGRKARLTGNDAEGNLQVANIREENGKTIIELMRASIKSLPSGVSGGK